MLSCNIIIMEEKLGLFFSLYRPPWASLVIIQKRWCDKLLYTVSWRVAVLQDSNLDQQWMTNHSLKRDAVPQIGIGPCCVAEFCEDSDVLQEITPVPPGDQRISHQMRIRIKQEKEVRHSILSEETVVAKKQTKLSNTD